MRRSRRGFTLIELFAVIGILALTFAVVLPLTENSVPSYRLGSAVRNVGGAIDFAASEAVAGRRPYGLIYDFESRSYSFLTPTEVEDENNPEVTRFILDESNEEAYVDPEVLPADVVLVSVQTGDGRVVDSGRILIRFDPLGVRGSHIVILGVRSSEDDASVQPKGVKFNALTRSLNYGDGNLTFYTE